MEEIWKALEKASLEHPGLHAVLMICLRFSSSLDSACVACCPFLSTGSHHARMQIHAMRCCIPRCTTKAFFRKGPALAVQTGCRLLPRSPLAKQKGLVQLVCSKLHAPTRNTRF